MLRGAWRVAIGSLLLVCALEGLEMPVLSYRYELRRGDEIVSTGRLSREEPFQVGERVVIGGQAGIVRKVEPLLGEQELRLVVQVWREGVQS
jgi:hypothetical protein